MRDSFATHNITNFDHNFRKHMKPKRSSFTFNSSPQSRNLPSSAKQVRLSSRKPVNSLYTRRPMRLLKVITMLRQRPKLAHNLQRVRYKLNTRRIPRSHDRNILIRRSAMIQKITIHPNPCPLAETALLKSPRVRNSIIKRFQTPGYPAASP